MHTTLDQHYNITDAYVFNPETRAFRTSGSYKLYPIHCKHPTTSQADQTLQAANEIHKALKLTPAQENQLSTQRKLQHIKALQDLTNIITNSTPPRVEPNEAIRVCKSTIFFELLNRISKILTY